jgi:hypothetical protein
VEEVLVRGLVQGPVSGSQSLDKITRFREGDTLRERDVDVTATVGGVVLDPTGTNRVQPRLDGTDVSLHPVDSSDRGVKVKEDRSARAILAKDPDGRRKCGERLSKSPFVLMRVRLSAVTGEADSELPGQQGG